ncbi:hypothetical protein AB4076_00220 [Dyella sp. 2RAF44]|uniref:hypothetical protein n=1 Tax=Dyella sp. 2RAF44 TaxID=3233000 RepID=UPI003F9059CE
MSLYVISYDLHKVRHYGPLINALKTAGAVEALESFWLANLAQTAIQVRDAVQSWIDADDSVVVLEIKPGSDWATYLARPVAVNWLHGHVHP